MGWTRRPRKRLLKWLISRSAPVNPAVRGLWEPVSLESSMIGSRLFYFGTQEEVRLADRVAIRRLLRKELQGTVTYIPGISPQHGDLEYEDVRQWAITCENGSTYPILYDPDNFQPPKKIRLIGRRVTNEFELPDKLEQT